MRHHRRWAASQFLGGVGAPVVRHMPGRCGLGLSRRAHFLPWGHQPSVSIASWAQPFRHSHAMRIFSRGGPSMPSCRLDQLRFTMVLVLVHLVDLNWVAYHMVKSSILNMGVFPGCRTSSIVIDVHHRGMTAARRDRRAPSHARHQFEAQPAPALVLQILSTNLLANNLLHISFEVI